MSEEAKIEKYLASQYGDGVVIDADFILQHQKSIVSVSPASDIAIGGIPEGSWVTLSGAPKCGKTTLALQIAANAQQKYDKFLYYLDVEGRFKEMNISGVHGLNKDKIRIIHSIKGKILSAEDFLNAGMYVIRNHPGSILIVDSSSALCAEKEMSEAITSQSRNSGPKLLASFCRQMGNVVPVQDTIVIIIQHLIANTSGYGAGYIEDGGQKIKYQSDIKLRCKGVERWVVKDEQVGQIVTWEVVHSALGAPGKKIENYIRYGYGIDKEMEIINIACDVGLITKGGAWYTCEWMEQPQKFQGAENLRQFLSENPQHYHKLYDSIRIML